MEGALKEILKFLQFGARTDLKIIAIENILGLTGSEEGIKQIYSLPSLLSHLTALLYDNNETVAKNASACLVNISANETAASKLLTLSDQPPPIQKTPEHIVQITLQFIINKNSCIADNCCKILSNLTRSSTTLKTIAEFIDNNKLQQLVEAFVNVKYNKHGENLDYVAAILSNLTQHSKFCKQLLDKNKNLLQQLLPFITYEESLVRRRGIAGAVKNCCFDVTCHQWLLSEDVDLLSRLLLPLAGCEEYDEEDNDKLPIDLQYLPESKIRENDAVVKCALLEALLQLCAEKCNRVYVRDKNSYIILRDLHKSETDSVVKLACEKIIDILIRTEEEIGEDNLKCLNVPDDLKEKFLKMDEDYVKGE